MAQRLDVGKSGVVGSRIIDDQKVDVGSRADQFVNDLAPVEFSAVIALKIGEGGGAVR